jgi:hypothetical protein
VFVFFAGEAGVEPLVTTILMLVKIVHCDIWALSYVRFVGEFSLKLLKTREVVNPDLGELLHC